MANDAMTKEEQNFLKLMGIFSRNTYDNAEKSYGDWKPLQFENEGTGETSFNGLNNGWTGYQAHAWVNDNTKEIVLGVSGTNDLLDMLSWPAGITGQAGGQIEDVLKSGKEINALVTGDKAAYAGYKVHVTGHSLGGTLAQVAAYTFGWNGASFDGPGAGAVVTGHDFKKLVNRLDITPVGKADNYINIRIEGEGLFGGSLVGMAGENVAGVIKNLFTKSPGTESVASFEHQISNLTLGLGFLPAKLISGIFLHNVDFMIKDIADGYVITEKESTSAPNKIVLSSGEGNPVLNTVSDVIDAGSSVVQGMAQGVYNGIKGLLGHNLGNALDSTVRVTSKKSRAFSNGVQEHSGNIFSGAWSLFEQVTNFHLEGDKGIVSDLDAYKQKTSDMPALQSAQDNTARHLK